jgi:hypothetical protein
MKTLILLSLFALVSCNSAGTQSGSSDEGDPSAAIDSSTCLDENNIVISCAPSNQDLELEYDSNGIYQNTGISLDQMGKFNEDRNIVLPEFLDLLEDSNAVIFLNDRVRMIFVTAQCDWHWNGAQFEFFACNGSLNGVVSGHNFTLRSIRSVSNPQMNGIIQMGVVRNPLNNFTGTIRVNANLQ